MYLVKSGYRFLTSNLAAAFSSQVPTIWKSIWKLQVSNKVKSFIWRVCADCLPTKRGLRMKKIDISDVCSVCNDSVEDIPHALVKCSYARKVWCQSGIEDRSGGVVMFEDWWKKIIQSQKMEDVNLAAMISWSLWNNKNDVVWNDRCKPFGWLGGMQNIY